MQINKGLALFTEYMLRPSFNLNFKQKKGEEGKFKYLNSD